MDDTMTIEQFYGYLLLLDIDPCDFWDTAERAGLSRVDDLEVPKGSNLVSAPLACFVWNMVKMSENIAAVTPMTEEKIKAARKEILNGFLTGLPDTLLQLLTETRI